MKYQPSGNGGSKGTSVRLPGFAFTCYGFAQVCRLYHCSLNDRLDSSATRSFKGSRAAGQRKPIAKQEIPGALHRALAKCRRLHGSVGMRSTTLMSRLPGGYENAPPRPVEPPFDPPVPLGTCHHPGSPRWDPGSLGRAQPCSHASAVRGPLELLGKWVHTGLPLTDHDHPPDHCPKRCTQAGECNGQEGGKLGHCHGHVPATGLRHTPSCRILPCGHPHLSSSGPRVVTRP